MGLNKMKFLGLWIGNYGRENNDFKDIFLHSIPFFNRKCLTFASLK